MLVKELGETTESPVDALLEAVRAGDDARVLSLVEVLKDTSAFSSPAQDQIIDGKWRQIWSQQAKDANPLQKRLSGNKSVRAFSLQKPVTPLLSVRMPAIITVSGSCCILHEFVSTGISTCTAVVPFCSTCQQRAC